VRRALETTLSRLRGEDTAAAAVEARR
jgi:hypothetical protein